MSNDTPSITELFGLTQHDIALLLGVTRSQWSMFALGQRDLPLDAKVQLAAMLQHMKAHEIPDKKALKPEPQQPKELEKLLQENTFQTVLISRKIDFIKIKKIKNSRVQILLDFLITHKEKRENHYLGALKVIEDKMSKSIEADDNTLLFKYELKLELLKFEKTLLEAELRNASL